MQFIGHYFDNYRLADVTDDMIEHAQQKLKVTLPESYINLMKQQNGGELHTKRLEIGEEVICINKIDNFYQSILYVHHKKVTINPTTDGKEI